MLGSGPLSAASHQIFVSRTNASTDQYRPVGLATKGASISAYQESQAQFLVPAMMPLLTRCSLREASKLSQQLTSIAHETDPDQFPQCFQLTREFQLTLLSTHFSFKVFNVEVLSTSDKWNIEKLTVVLNYRNHLPARSLALAWLFSSWVAQML